MNGYLFMKYVCYSKQKVQLTKDNSVLLVEDSRSSHFSLAAVNYWCDNCIHMLAFSPQIEKFS